jgi:hypothetical protein
LFLRRYILVLAALALAAPAWAQHGALTVPRNLDQLVDRSAVILRGNVVSARVEKHPEFQNLDTVVVTLRVRESLKGDAGTTFTFRQYVWDLRDRSVAAGYRKGQHLLLLMIAPSRFGLSSPAGLEQGRFLIRREASGREIAANAHANVGLFEGVGAKLGAEGKTLAPGLSLMINTHRSGPVPLAELTGLIREMSQGSR